MLYLLLALLVLLLGRAIWLILPFIVRVILTVILDIAVVTWAIRAMIRLRDSDSGVIVKIIKFLLELAIAIPFALDLIFWAKLFL